MGKTVVAAGVLALLAGTLAAPAGASARTGTQQGVTDDTIQIALIVPDLDALIARGIPLSGQSTQAFVKKFEAYTKAYGPINGRTIEVIRVPWDPQDATSFDKACTQATQDNKPFLVVNGSGYRDSHVPCVTIDNKTPMIIGDPIGQPVFDESGKNLITTTLPPEVAGKEGAKVLVQQGLIPKTAKVAILSNNVPGPKAGADAVEKELEKRGIDVVSKVEVNGLASDATLLRREAAAAAGTFQAAGADTMINVNAWSGISSIFDEMARTNYRPTVFAVDGQSNTCTINGAARMPTNAPAITCVTANSNSVAADSKGVRTDNKLEAECRADFEAEFGTKTDRNAPNGQNTVNGVTYFEDISPEQCNIANFLLPAIKKAGKKLTWAKVYKNILNTSSIETAYLSGGEGGFAKNKPYLADKMHIVELSNANASTPKGANGTFAGCPTPFGCWVPQTVDGEEWFAISKQV